MLYLEKSKRARRELAVLLGLILSLIICGIFNLGSFAEACGEVRGATLRLHILANSDSAADQSLKLAVRDAVLEGYGEALGSAKDKAQAKAILLENAAAIRRTALSVIRQNGFTYDVKVSLENAYFSTKNYDDLSVNNGESFTLPAGMYDAVRIEIGKAEGHNWFCIMYPQMCISAAGGQSKSDENESGGDAQIKAESAEKSSAKADATSGYTARGSAAIKSTATIKFAAVEIIEKIKYAINKQP